MKFSVLFMFVSLLVLTACGSSDDSSDAAAASSSLPSQVSTDVND